jgi:putative intracellular protease/amidase
MEVLLIVVLRVKTITSRLTDFNFCQCGDAPADRKGRARAWRQLLQGGLWKAFAVRDGRLITGQQQYSSHKLAKPSSVAEGAAR